MESDKEYISQEKERYPVCVLEADLRKNYVKAMDAFVKISKDVKTVLEDYPGDTYHNIIITGYLTDEKLILLVKNAKFCFYY
ncbi:hypothetical protein NB644_05400 [Oxalobacter formigenes]|uniref:hypothetical protein n=1 Tax=Oxalobacter formigenes TaxID=847 RepID=UPI0022AF32AD|nr:hypothetical protein [Oxalobacter formigenes]WAW02460.1 hypothetical protein NB644_05400 [Oxalobacter formigenes]WAW02728.1 hypothetical protein NB642_06195 [Oxalobacter formigenes]